MQHRMKTHQLTKEEMIALLSNCQTGTLATVNPDGTPYSVPVHYVLLHDMIYIHGLPAGQKIRNIKDNPNVSFNAYEMRGLLIDCEGKPCDTNTDYVSVVIHGTARLLEDTSEKENVLRKIIQKYTPHLTEKEIPMNMLRGTAVIQIAIRKMTGKYYH